MSLKKSAPLELSIAFLKKNPVEESELQSSYEPSQPATGGKTGPSAKGSPGVNPTAAVDDGL